MKRNWFAIVAVVEFVMLVGVISWQLVPPAHRGTGVAYADDKPAAAEPAKEAQPPAAEAPAKTQITIDDSEAKVLYSKQVLVSGTDEDITLDFGANIRPNGPNAGKLKIDQRIILNPYAAKRLSLALSQVVARYEKTYGVLELDSRKRMIAHPND